MTERDKKQIYVMEGSRVETTAKESTHKFKESEI